MADPVEAAALAYDKVRAGVDVTALKAALAAADAARMEGADEQREKAHRLAIDVYNNGATFNAKNFRDPVAFRAAVNYVFDAALAVGASTITLQAARIEALENALKPLAECEIPDGCEGLPDTDSQRYSFSFGEVRRARATLEVK